MANPRAKDLTKHYQRAVIGSGKKFADYAMFDEVLQKTCKHFGIPPIDTQANSELLTSQVIVLAGMLELTEFHLPMLALSARRERTTLSSETASDATPFSVADVQRYINTLSGARKRTMAHNAVSSAQEKQLEEDIADGRVPSFAEIVEKVYKEKLLDIEGQINLKTFLFDEVFAVWQSEGKKLSPERFCKMVAARNKNADGKETLSNEVIYNWKNDPKKHPFPESIVVLCKAFDLSLEQEAMLWKIIAGSPFKNPYPAADETDGPDKCELDKAIDAAETSKDHGPLVKALREASGIPGGLLMTILDNQQLYQWENRRAHIETNATANLFIGLTNPENNDEQREAVAAQNQRILALVTGKISDIPAMLESVRESRPENPGGALLTLLTSARKGLVPLSGEKLVEKMKAKGCAISDNTAKKMRSSRYQRGCTISKERARVVMEIVAEGAGTVIPEHCHRECIEMLMTNYVSYDKAGEPAGFAQRLAAETIPDTVETPETDTARLPLSPIEKFKRKFGADWTARKVAGGGGVGP